MSSFFARSIFAVAAWIAGPFELRGSKPVGEKRFPLSTTFASAAVGVAAALSSVPVCASDFNFIKLVRNVGMIQSSDGGEALTGNGASFSTTVSTQGGFGYSSASVTFPGPSSPGALSAQQGNVFSYQSGSYLTQADMDAAFPTGTYKYTFISGGFPFEASLKYNAAAYPLSQPYLDGTSYSALQGMSVAAPLTLTFSPLVPSHYADGSFISFTIYDFTDNQFVFDAPFLSPDTASQTLAANLLVAGHPYGYELGFLSLEANVAAPGTNNGGEIDFNSYTTGLFSTVAPVPEPETWLLLASGLAACGSVTRRRRA